ncbi:hypothetical protein, partial [Litchfieldia salsa]|uniref:hypothetical protein n=1 Tax=Litchfieldia salsa TaxID=930152 RepID=UPI00195E82FD
PWFVGFLRSFAGFHLDLVGLPDVFAGLWFWLFAWNLVSWNSFDLSRDSTWISWDSSMFSWDYGSGSMEEAITNTTTQINRQYLFS